MHITREVLSRIVARAASLTERLDAVVHSGSTWVPTLHARKRMARWSTVTSRGDPERFARRLTFDGVTSESALRALDDVEVEGTTDGVDNPAWAVLLQRALCIPMSRLHEVSSDPLAPLPFECVLRRFVLAARDELAIRAADAALLLTPRARAQFERVLLHRLASLATPTLTADRDCWRTHLSADGSDAWATGCDEAHLRHLHDGELITLFADYASLARLMATCALYWVESTSEMARRLATDNGQLAEEFNDGRSLGDVVDAEAGLSDPHRRGRSVSILRFASGLKLAYKPRSLAMERTFADVVAWLGQRSEGPRLMALRVLDRGTHGWMECAEFASCTEDAQVPRYFERGGMLLCLMHALGGSDIHHDNVLACGEHPLVLDLEALAGPTISPQGLSEDDDPAPWSYVLDSALATGMVPMLRPRYDGTTESYGGLTADGHSASSQLNVPRLRGARVRDDHADSVLAGYRRMYRTLLAHGAALSAPDGPLARIGAAHTRIILRSTQVYLSLLQRAAAPRFMRAGVDRSIELEVFRQPFTKYPYRHRLWPALSSELASLEALDVPIFEARAGDTTVFTDRGPIDGYLRTSGRDRIMDRISGMCDGDLQRQLHYIRLAYSEHRYHRTRAARTAEECVSRLESDFTVGGAALDAVETLARSAVTAPDGGVTWYALGAGASAGNLDVVDQSLGCGRVGIAMFLAAAAHVHKDERSRRLALAALGSVITSSTNRTIPFVEELGIARGDGGIAYGLAKVAQLLGECELLCVAQQVAARISPSRIAEADDYTVWNGLSGALLGLLAVHRAAGSVVELDRAASCGRRLLSARVADPATGLRAWPTREGDFATGFAYGAAGIAHALLSLHEIVGAPGLRDAALEAMEFESSLFVPAHKDWVDCSSLRMQRSRPVTRVGGWHRGAPGIGLSRAAHLAVTDTPRARADIAVAVAGIVGAVPGTTPQLARPDHLWCGNLGHTELLMTAGARLGRPDLTACALDLAQRVASRARRRGTYGGGTMHAAFTPGMFDGLAGIGYQLLRVGDPVAIPSILLLE